MLTPEEEFETWASILTSCIEPGGEFTLLLEDYERLVVDYCETGELAGPLADHTTTFAKYTMKSVINALMAMTHLSQGEIETVTGCCQRLSCKLAIGALNGHADCMDALMKILNPTNSFYTKNGRRTITTNVDLVNEMTDETAKTVMDAVAADPKLETCLFLGKLLKSRGNRIWPGTVGVLCSIEEAVRVILGSFDSKNLREVDGKSLAKFTEFLEENISRDVREEFGEFMFCFGLMCLKSGFVDKQITGAKFLAGLGYEFYEWFPGWARKYDLLGFIMEKELHASVLVEVKKCMSYIAKGTKMTYDEVLDLFRKMGHTGSSRKEIMESLIFQGLRGADTLMIEEFVTTVMGTEELTHDLVQFTMKLAVDVTRRIPSTIPKMTVFVLRVMDSDMSVETIDWAITKLQRLVLPKDTLMEVHKYVLDKLEALPKLGDKYKCMKKLILEVCCLGMDTKYDLMDRLMSAYEHDDERSSCYLKLIGGILKKSDVKISEKAFRYLLASDDGCTVLLKLMRKKGIGFVDREMKDRIFAMIQGIGLVHFSYLQMRCLEFIMMCIAYGNRDIEGFSCAYYDRWTTTIRVIDPFVDGLSLIMDVAAVAEAESTRDYALSVILALFGNATMQHCENLATDYAELLRSNEMDNHTVLARHITIINAFIMRSEETLDLARFGIHRHKMCHKNDITVTVICDNKQMSVRCQPYITGKKLSRIVASRLGLRDDAIWLKYKDAYLAHNNPLNVSGVRDGSQLTIWKSSSAVVHVIHGCMTTVFANGELVKRMYKLLQEGNLDTALKKAVWKFMMLMPTVKSIETMEAKDFMLLINEAKSELELRYLLQVAVQRHDEGLGDTVFEMLVADKIPACALGEALAVAKDNWELATVEDVRKICELLVGCLADKSMSKVWDVALDSLAVAATRYPMDIVKCFTGNAERFKDVICGIDTPLFEKLETVFCRISEGKKEVLDVLVTFVDFIKDSDARISGYFRLVAIVFDESCDLENFVQFALTLWHDPESHVFYSISKFLQTIFSERPDKCLVHPKVFNVALDSLFATTSNATQKSLVALIDAFRSRVPEYESRVKTVLIEKFGIVIDRWGFRPDGDVKSRHGLTGLRNLGATCYMNSVMQQLFYNVAFRKSILESKPEKDWQIEVKWLFARLLLTKKRQIDTRPFAAKWKFYGDTPVDTRVQQDAVEFMQMFLDRLNDKFYRGEILNQMAGVSKEDGFNKSHSDQFWALMLPVKGCESFDLSLSAFLQKETVTGYRDESTGKDIDIVKFTQVQTAPDYLVVQLQRFEYDLTEWVRCKINDKFKFEKEFDLAKVMVDENAHHKYTLTGIVIHNGTAEGGHYTSFVRVKNRWFLFDDSNVSEADEATVLKEAFGRKASQYDKHEEHVPSAYMLFYAKSGLIKDEEDSVCVVDPDIAEVIEKENKEHVQTLVTFGPVVAAMVFDSRDYDVVIPYFFNVFAHSADGTRASEMMRHVMLVIEENNGANRVACEYLHVIGDIIVNCNKQEIVKAVIDVVSRVLALADRDYAVNMTVALFDKMMAVSSMWRVIPAFLELLIGFLARNIDIVQESGWVSRLIDFVRTSLDSAKSSVFLQNANFMSIFVFLMDHTDIVSREQFDDLYQVSGKIIQSAAHANCFIQFVGECSKRGYIEMHAVFDTMVAGLKDMPPAGALSLIVQFSTSTEMCMKLIESPKLSKEGLVDGIRVALDSTNQEIYHCLRENPIVCFSLLICNSENAIDGMEQVCLMLFDRVSPLESYPRGEDAMDKSLVNVDWVDDPNPMEPFGDEALIMINLLNVFIERLDDVNKCPEKYISGRIANRRLTNLFRVMLWMLVRTHMVPSDEHILVFIRVLETYKKLNVVNDCNLIELLRLFGVVPDLCLPCLTSNFDRIVRSVFGKKYEGTYAQEWAFATFFKAFARVFDRDASCLTIVLNSDQFCSIFASILESTCNVHFTAFVNALSLYDADCSDFVHANISALLASNCRKRGMKLLVRAKRLVLSDEAYSFVVSDVFGHIVDMNAVDVENFYGDILVFLASQGPHTITDTSVVNALIKDVMKLVKSIYKAVYSEALATLILTMTKQPEIMEVVYDDTNIDDTNADDMSFWSSTYSTLIRAISAAHENSDVCRFKAASALCEEYMDSSQLYDADFLLRWLCDVIRMDGFMVHESWALAVVYRMLTDRYIQADSAGTAFLRAAILSMSDSMVMEIARREVENADELMSLHVIDKIICVKPHLRSQLILDLGMSESDYDACEDRYEHMYRYIFNSEKVGKYRIRKTLFVNERGSIHVVRKVDSNQRFILKKIVLGKDKNAVKSVENEIFAHKELRKLECPGLITANKIIREEGFVGLVMEYCEGGDLLGYIKVNNVRENVARSIMKCLITTIGSMHNAGFAHLDIKPDNILLVGDKKVPDVRICDFGCTSELKDAPFTNRVTGTAWYHAPELLGKESYNESVDMWALGLVMHAILMDCLPYTFEDGSVSLDGGLFALLNISEDACSLMEMLLEYDPKRRIKACEAVNHPWFAVNRSTEVDIKGIFSDMDDVLTRARDEDDDGSGTM